MEHQPPPFFERGPSSAARLVFFALLSIGLIIADARLKYLDVVRQSISFVIYPLQRLAVSPVQFYHRASDFFVTQTDLQTENERLAEQNLLNAAQLQRLDSLESENDHLRKLLDAKPRLGRAALMAEILYAGRDPLTRKITVDKGAQHGVIAGRAVVDEIGVIGQVTSVLPWMSEVTLITDKEQAVPIQIARSGLRAIVFGSGQENTLDLRYIPVDADIRVGDQLVTSGLDGTYPAGLPVAVVSNIESDAAYSFAKITCTAAAGVSRHRQVLILSIEPLPVEKAEGRQPSMQANESTKGP